MTAKLLAVFLLAVVPASASVARAQSMAPSDGAGSAKRGIDEAWVRAAEALKKGDAASLAALYTSDAMVIGPDGPTTSGMANIEKDMKGMFAASKYLDITRQATVLDVSGDLAVDTGVYTITAQQQGKPPAKATMRYVMVWKRVKGKWLLHREMLSPMPAGSN